MIPTRIGQLFDSCTFAGINRIKNNIYAILVAPKEAEVKVPFGEVENLLPTSLNDGYTSTAQLNSTEYFAPHYAKNLTLGNTSDFYLPSINEILLCYTTLRKPTTYIYEWHYPVRLQQPMIKDQPDRSLIVTRFIVGSEQFNPCEFYWSSTVKNGLVQYTDPDFVCAIDFLDGGIFPADYYDMNLVRPVRRIQIV